MSLQKLDVFRVRNIQSSTIYPATGLNFIYGNNGSGKSALLEAIFMLGRARSFRTHNIKQVIQHTADDLVVSGQCVHENGHATQLGIQLSQKDSQIRINHTPNCKRSELAYAFPVQFVYPKSYQLLDGSSSLRREFVDWGIFNQDEQYLIVWQKFKKCLLHRNALLKAKQLDEIYIWDNELAQYASIVSNYRAEYLQQLEGHFNAICRIFLDIEDIALKYYSGWDSNKTLLEILKENITRDSRYGVTHYGAHRADFLLMVNKFHAKEYLSRGQLKLCVLAFKLAQIQILPEKFSKIGCFLIDDFSAELDSSNKNKLLQFLARLNMQVFITANEANQFGDFSFINNYKLFHVEHGSVKQV